MKGPLHHYLAFHHHAMARLFVLAMAMGLLWWLATPAGLTPDEWMVWDKVSAAQQHVRQWRIDQGDASSEAADPWHCGLIGLEWSEISTTLGDITSKRTACHPAWAIQFMRWFEQQGLGQGDSIAIYSSASFPGLLLSAIAASEAGQLDLLLVVSLGASSWGANDPALPWPLLEAELRRAGLIQTRADYYTLGGASELGHDLSADGLESLQAAAESAGVEILTANDLEGIIELKSSLLVEHQSKLMVSIGGSHANLGDEPVVLELQPGRLAAPDIDLAGNGVIAQALRRDIAVIHMLNLRQLSQQSGIPFDSEPRPMAPGKVSALSSAAGLLLFFLVVARHRRWRVEDAHESST